MQGAEQVVHQRQDDIEIAPLHQLAAVMQGVQPVHLANPRQARHRVFGGQVFAGVEHFVEQVTEDHAPGKQTGHVGAQSLEQPPGGEGDRQAVQHDQPSGEQNHAPVPGAIVGHVAGGEETVVITGVACVEQPGQGVFVVAEVAVDEVDAEVEEHQGQGDCQPLQRGDLRSTGPGQGDAENAVAEDEAGVEPGVVMGAHGSAVAGAKGLGRMGHDGKLGIFLLESELSWQSRMCEFLRGTHLPHFDRCRPTGACAHLIYLLVSRKMLSITFALKIKTKQRPTP